MTKSDTTSVKIITVLCYLILLLPLVITPHSPSFAIYCRSGLFFLLVELMILVWAWLAYNSSEYRPRRTALLAAVGVLIIVQAAACLGSESLYKSFWGTHIRQYEAGLWAWLHYALLFLVLASSIKNKTQWLNLFRFSLGVSFLVAIYSIFQYLNLWFTTVAIDGRLSGTFGNPIFLGVYLLIHIFLAGYLAAAEEKKGRIWMYGVIALFELTVLYFTESRGVYLGLLTGLGMTLVGLVIKKNNWHLRLAQGLLIFTIITSLVIALNPSLWRSISDKSSFNRFIAWGSAVSAWQSKPILGWGEENFNLAFEKNYNPAIFFYTGDITWFDRVHNSYLGILVIAGLVGLLAYLWLWLVAFKSLGNYENKKERAILIGLLTAYLVQDAFLFDFNVSLIFCFLLFAFISSQDNSGKQIGIQKFKLISVALWALAAVFMFFNIIIIGKAVMAERWHEKSVIAKDNNVKLELFKKALAKESLANLNYVREDYVLKSVQEISVDKRVDLVDYYFVELDKQLKLYPKETPLIYRRGQLLDIRYQETNNSADLDVAYQDLLRACELSPGRQQVFFELGQNRRLAGDLAESINWLKQATASNDQLPVSHFFLGIAYVFNNQGELGGKEIKTAFDLGYTLLVDDRDRMEFLIDYYTKNQNYQMLEFLYKKLINLGKSADYYARLAAVYKELGKKDEAVEAALEAWELDSSLGNELRLFLKDLGVEVSK
jgi:O-antigen ligase/tetratricopeptide (TPR) repeat protein